jgi:uncharacterized protein YndB with AHSA1/START domain
MNPFRTSRLIAAPIEAVFAAIGTPHRLARWWGPSGFTNTFHTCEFKPCGRWSFVMHGPDGKDYPNENTFAEIDVPSKVVVEHLSEPRFRLTLTLLPAPGGTTVDWEQTFESPDTARRVAAIVIPANEQNLDRLTAEIIREHCA